MSDVSTSTAVEVSATQSQTPASLSDRTPRKMLLRKELFAESKRRKELESVMSSNPQLAEDYCIDIALKVCEKYCSKTVCLFVKSQINNKNRKSKGYRYSNDIKQLALNIYFISPKLYKNMQKPLSLPSCRTLRRVTNRYEITPGLNDFLFNLLSYKINSLLPDALDCVLCADEMSLKTHLFYKVDKDRIVGFHETTKFRKYELVKYALVLMLRGINHNWKQPIAYFLVFSSCSGNDLKDIIFSTISRLQNIKLNIKAFITDQGSNFSQFAKNLYVSPGKPYFEVDSVQIAYNLTHLI